MTMFEKSITRYSAEELKIHLRTFILQAITLGEESVRLAAKMEPFGCSLTPIRGISAADSALRAWARAAEVHASDEYAEGTGATLHFDAIEGLDFPFSVPDGGCSLNRHESMRWDWIAAEKLGIEAQTEVLDKLLDLINFQTLQTGLQIATAGLATKGKQEAADTISTFINLAGYARKPTELKPKGLVFTVSFGGTSEGLERYNFRNLLAKATAAIRTAEEETGIAGISSALDSMARSLWDSHAHTDLPSRTKIGIPGILSTTIFKNHSEFVMESSRADALLSFVAMYSTRELRDIQNRTGLIA